MTRSLLSSKESTLALILPAGLSQAGHLLAEAQARGSKNHLILGWATITNAQSYWMRGSTQ